MMKTRITKNKTKEEKKPKQVFVEEYKINPYSKRGYR